MAVGSNKLVPLPDTTAPFRPQDHLMKLQGKDYLPVAARIAWLNQEFGHEYVISTDLVEHNKSMGKNPRNTKEEMQIGEALFKARVTFPNGKFVEAYGSETSVDFKDYIEKAETKALGRALGFAGYGTLFAPEFDESATISRAESRDRAAENTYENTRAADTAVDLGEMRARREARKAAEAEAAPVQEEEEKPSAPPKTTKTSGPKLADKHSELKDDLLALIARAKGKQPLETQVSDLIKEANVKGGTARASLLPEEDLLALVNSVRQLVDTHS